MRTSSSRRLPMSVLRTYPVILPVIFLMVLLVPGTSRSLTIDDAIGQAKQNLPSFKASETQVKATRALYDASLGPYLPSLDTTTVQQHHSARFEDFDLSTYDVTLSYILFDGGQRSANRSIARLNLDTDKEEVNKNLLQLRFDVTAAFYTAMARNEIVEHRTVQLNDAKKDFEVAQGRHKFGLVKLSDVLQASVRLEQAKFSLVQARGELNKTVSELNSLIGRPLDSSYDLAGTLDLELILPAIDRLSRATLERPEIKQAKNSVAISENNKTLATSAFFPTVTANVSYQKTDVTGLATSDEDKSVGITATWNLFELGKFYQRKSAAFSIDVSRQGLEETVRQLLLGLQKAYEDFVTASNNVGVAQEQLKQADQNYSQAYGEYRVGKGDILSLVQAESSLSAAREQLTTSKLNLVLSKALLERATGVEKLERLGP